MGRNLSPPWKGSPPALQLPHSIVTCPSSDWEWMSRKIHSCQPSAVPKGTPPAKEDIRHMPHKPLPSPHAQGHYSNSIFPGPSPCRGQMPSRSALQGGIPLPWVQTEPWKAAVHRPCSSPCTRRAPCQRAQIRTCHTCPLSLVPCGKMEMPQVVWLSLKKVWGRPN